MSNTIDEEVIPLDPEPLPDVWKKRFMKLLNLVVECSADEFIPKVALMGQIGNKGPTTQAMGQIARTLTVAMLEKKAILFGQEETTTGRNILGSVLLVADREALAALLKECDDMEEDDDDTGHDECSV